MKKYAIGQIALTGLLLIAAVLFGMVLTGEAEITPAGFSAPAPQRVETTAPAGLPSFADIAEAVMPAVATVRVVTIETTSARQSSPFEFFFQQRGQQRPDEPREFRQDGAGSGFAISPDGWLVTNYHVVEGATSVRVTLDGKEYDAEVKGQDPPTDLALLKIEPKSDLEYLALGDSDALRVGDWVMAIGDPHLFDHSVTVGVVSGKGRAIGITDRSFENFIQTDAAINRGNSGGPLVNVRGEVIGISTAMNFGAENIGFAVPVSTLRSILPQLRDDGRVSRGFLGVSIQDVDADIAEAFGAESRDGAFVSQVQADTPAEKGGIRNGDIIVKVDDVDVSNTRQLIDYVAHQRPGTKVRIELLRNGDQLDRTIVLEERPGDQIAAVPEPEESSELEWLGIQYQGLTPGSRQMHNLPEDLEGVWVTDVRAASPLVDEGVQPNDFITEVNGQAVDNADGFESAVNAAESGRFLRFYVRRVNPQNPTQEQGFFAIIRKP